VQGENQHGINEGQALEGGVSFGKTGDNWELKKERIWGGKTAHFEIRRVDTR